MQIIRTGQVRPLALEGTGLELYEVDATKYFLLEGSLTEEDARSYLGKLSTLKSNPVGPFKNITVIVEPCAKLSFEARELLSQAGLELIQSEPSNEKPGSPSGTSEHVNSSVRRTI